MPNSSKLTSLGSQIATLESISTYNYNFKYKPKLFTENGVAMLSSVLKSKTAIQRLDCMDEIIAAKLPKTKRKIGLKD
jgi:hypothetical protein